MRLANLRANQQLEAATGEWGAALDGAGTAAGRTRSEAKTAVRGRIAEAEPQARSTERNRDESPEITPVAKLKSAGFELRLWRMVIA